MNQNHTRADRRTLPLDEFRNVATRLRSCADDVEVLREGLKEALDIPAIKLMTAALELRLDGECGAANALHREAEQIATTMDDCCELFGAQLRRISRAVTDAADILTAKREPCAIATRRTPEQILDDIFSRPREPRSAEYKSGMLSALHYRLEGRSIRCPYEAGTAERDAFFAGIEEGHAVARKLGGEVQR